MYKRLRLILLVTAFVFITGRRTPLHSQERRYITPPAQVVAIRAGRLFDAKSGSLLNNQIILIKGERITDVGPNLQIPREAAVIDLSTATVLPGMIDAHVH